MLKGFIFIVVKFISAVEPRQLLTSAYRSCGEEARKKLTPTCLNGMSDYADSYTKIKGGNIVGSSTTPGYYAHALPQKPMSRSMCTI
jgi:hypothetical protein